LDLAGAITLGLGDPELYALKEAGKRMSDTLNAKVVFGQGGVACYGKWMAFSLEDGSGGLATLYDTRAAAIKAMSNKPGRYWFESVRPTSYSADECALLIQYARAAYSSGWRPDVDYPAPIAPVRIEDAHRKFRQLRRNARRR
jgi:hypothetical protein